MGLDMYLKGRRFLSTFFHEGDDKIKAAVAELFPELKDMKGRFEEGVVDEVSIDVGYWRKANAIHAWFVKNVQNGEDECRPHHVSRKALQQLKDICEQVLKDHKKASTLLPTQEGFFFGDTGYHQHYFNDLRQTVEIVDRCLALPESWEFEYRSSW